MPAAPRSIRYAEETLGVHKVYEETIGRLENFGVCLQAQSNLRQSIREYQQLIAEREHEIAEEIRLSHPDMSQAAFERELKRTCRNDESWIQRNQEMNNHKDQLDENEVELNILKGYVNIGTARMHELGGYLEYLAAIKNGATVASRVTDSPW